MDALVQFVVEHGYYILFTVLFAHQLGLPLPGPLFLLAAGALAAARKLGFVPAVGVATAACVLADWARYEVGRRGGEKVLHLLHRFTRDPDFHDRRAKETFVRYGAQLLVVAKFFPGLDAVMPPLAGTSHTTRLRFLAFDAIGAGLYSSADAGLGYIFSHDLNRAATYDGRVASVLTVLLLVGLSIWDVCKLAAVHSSILDLRVVQLALTGGTTSGDSVANPCSLLQGLEYEQ